jgi:exodeoxyribonuclease V alpha subunit
MVDVPLMRAVLRALPTRAALLLVDDVDQLPSVGPGQVLADIIASGTVLAVRLTEIFRRSAESCIVTNAHRINQGLMPDLAPVEGGDFYFVDGVDAQEGMHKLLAIVQKRIPKRFGLDPMRDIRVFCPINRGGLGARSLNIELQNALDLPGEIRIERFGRTFCSGDKVMQVENDYDKEVYNGDLGVVSRIDMEESELAVDFDGRKVTYRFGELDELVLS